MTVEWYFHPKEEKWYHIEIDMEKNKIFIDGEEYKLEKEVRKKDECMD